MADICWKLNASIMVRLQRPTFFSASFIMYHHGTILKENIQMEKNLSGPHLLHLNKLTE